MVFFRRSSPAVTRSMSRKLPSGAPKAPGFARGTTPRKENRSAPKALRGKHANAPWRRVCPVVTRSVARACAAAVRRPSTPLPAPAACAAAVRRPSTPLPALAACAKQTEAASAGPFSWVAATDLRNYFAKDPFLDWADYHLIDFAQKNPGFAAHVPRLMGHRGARTWVPGAGTPAAGHSRPAAAAASPGSFTEFIMNQGVEFEKKVVAYLFREYGRDNVRDLGGQGFAATMAELARGTPIIFSAYVQHDATKTYGIPDLLVRRDWLRKLVATEPPPPPEEAEVGPDRRFYYVVVDVKCSTLPLRSDGVHLLNSVAAYKAQLFIYNRALAAMQGYDPGAAYILGKRWKYTEKGTTRRGTSCFDRLGVVDFRDVDEAYERKVADATAWVNAVRRDGAAWNPLAPPLPHPNLYPNMSNARDYPWHGVKSFIATANREITSLWQCGPSNREHALARGVCRWTDADCSCETLNVTSAHRGPVLAQLLKVNRAVAGPLVTPARLAAAPFPKRQRGAELYVDFETVNDVAINDFSQFPHTAFTTLIFMIGVGRRDAAGAWVFRHFTAAALTAAEQARICGEFEEYVREVWQAHSQLPAGASSRRGLPEPPRLFHWGNAEQNLWRNAGQASFALADAGLPAWCDLLALFRKEPIIVKGSLGFGLKTVAGALHRLGHVETTWVAGSACTDGASAMLHAVAAYKECVERGVPCVDTQKIREIIAYNEVDCRVLLEIVEYLRAHHL